MAWVDPPIRATGDDITAAIWNQDVKDNSQYLKDELDGLDYPETALMFHRHSEVTNGNALTETVNTAHPFGHYAEQSAAADADAFRQSFMLKAGTYDIHIRGRQRTDAGKLDWTLDGNSIATGQDWYGANTDNFVKTISSVTVTGNGRHLLAGTVNGKNGSSSDYRIMLTEIWFEPAEYTQGV